MASGIYVTERQGNIYSSGLTINMLCVFLLLILKNFCLLWRFLNVRILRNIHLFTFRIFFKDFLKEIETVYFCVLFHLENQLRVFQSSTDKPDENIGAASTSENSNNTHPEHTNTPYDDDNIYDMGKSLCYCLGACMQL